MNYMIKTASNDRLNLGLFKAGNYYGIVRQYATSDDLLVSRHGTFDEADSYFSMLLREYGMTAQIVQHGAELYANYD
jgi:hypothetical protein